MVGKDGKETKRGTLTENIKGNIFLKVERFLVLESALVSRKAKDIPKK